MTAGQSIGADSRVVELDALRGIAAVAVLVYHLPRGFWFGASGVDLFFVLSGFLITGIILRGRDQPNFFRTFYWRRSLRIFPIYYLALLVAWALNWLRSTPAETTGLPYYFVYLQHIHEYWGSTTPPADISLGHTWTLAIEEQFYLFWPVALVLTRKRYTPWLIGLMIVMPVVFRTLGLPRNVLLGHTDGLAMGAMLAWIMNATSPVNRVKHSYWFGGISIAAFVVYWAMWQVTSSVTGMSGNDFIAFSPAMTVVSIAYAGLIGLVVCQAGSRRQGWLRSKHLARMGAISYGLYLYHWIIYETIDTVVKFGMQVGDPLWLDALKVGSAVTVAMLSWRWIEQPILRLKDRFQYDSQSGDAANTVRLPDYSRRRAS